MPQADGVAQVQPAQAAVELFRDRRTFILRPHLAALFSDPTSGPDRAANDADDAISSAPAPSARLFLP